MLLLGEAESLSAKAFQDLKKQPNLEVCSGINRTKKSMHGWKHKRNMNCHYGNGLDIILVSIATSSLICNESIY